MNLAGLDEVTALKNYRQFLITFNQMSECCFLSCVTSLNSRELTKSEEACVKSCIDKQVNVNNRLMVQFLQQGPALDKQLQQGIMPGILPS
jgi:predicted O-linked N-acetylglucosamine transferase (SPINDLY family)